MDDRYYPGYISAINDFREARHKAGMETLLGRLRGEATELLSYEDVLKKLKGVGRIERGLQEVPLDAIVGSVGRYTDFTRSFLPLLASDAERWARVKLAVSGMEGLPPIEVYKIGDAYFVKDGNHRVSVARQLGATHIQAYVTEVQTKVPLTPDVKPDDLILKAEYADFLERTHLDEIRPEADLTLTIPGRYQDFEEHIAVHRYFMGLEQHKEIPAEEAIADWYDTVYEPVVEIIRKTGVLCDFPDRAEADLYLWTAEHSEALKESLGWEVEPAAAVEDLAAQFSSKTGRVIARLGGKLLSAVTPKELESGPPPGTWREERLAYRRSDYLFCDILVAISGQESGWKALDQAIEVARREGASLRGLHVVPTSKEVESENALAAQAEFNRRCAEAGVRGELIIDVGQAARVVSDRAYWADLVVASLDHPPGPQPFDKLGSGFRTLAQRCPRPLLAVPCPIFPLERALLAYDGSPKSEEALFIATYMAARWPELSLVVVTVRQGADVSDETIAHAREYLERHDVHATYVTTNPGPIGSNILITAEEYDGNLIIMGGYSHGAMLEVVLGSVVDEVLRSGRRPVLICR